MHPVGQACGLSTFWFLFHPYCDLWATWCLCFPVEESETEVKSLACGFTVDKLWSRPEALDLPIRGQPQVDQASRSGLPPRHSTKSTRPESLRTVLPNAGIAGTFASLPWLLAAIGGIDHYFPQSLILFYTTVFQTLHAKGLVVFKKKNFQSIRGQYFCERQ